MTVFVVPLAPVNVAHSFDLTFTWDANTEPDLAGYRLYDRQEDQYYDYNNPVWDGSESTCTIYSLDDRVTYCFVARTHNVYGDEGGDSVEVCYDPEMIERLRPGSSEPGLAINIVGKGFGVGIVEAGTPAETNSVVHVGQGI